MSKLKVTLIDVGWGDSILVESEDNNGKEYYGLIDSNDTQNYRSSFIFLKRHFEKKNIKLPDDKPIFEFVILSHAHSDHGQGLKRIMREFGTKNFWYPKSLEWSSLSELIRFANLSSNVVHHQSIDDTKINAKIGDIVMNILWPPHDVNKIDPHNENNNSIVAVLPLNQVSFVLSGDAEEKVWNQIYQKLPQNEVFFKVPHHGSVNGTSGSQTGWFRNCPGTTLMGISSHIRPFSHPDQQVIDLFNANNRHYYRTDEHYHITYQTDGNTIKVKYSHF